VLDQRGRLLVAALGFAGCSLPSYSDVLHDRDGALAYERDGYSVGADALASGTAGGVDGSVTLGSFVSWDDAYLRWTDKGLRIVALGFFIGMAATGVGFLAARADVRWLAIGAWTLGQVGWAVAILGILRGCVRMLRGRRGQ
jgi:hypothetical protein